MPFEAPLKSASTDHALHTLWGATVKVKFMAYRCIIHPILEYGCQRWNPFTQKDVQLLENIQCMVRCSLDMNVVAISWDPLKFLFKKPMVAFAFATILST